MPFFDYLTKDSGMRDITLHRPEQYQHLSRFTEDILRGPSPLTLAERELIAGYVSALNACQFCYGTHKAVASEFGIDEAIFLELLDSIDTSRVDERLKPLLRFVQKLTLTPSRMLDADADAVYAAGWNEDALHDAVAVCGLFCLFNRLVDGHGIKGHESVFRQRGKIIAREGYSPEVWRQ